MNFLKELKKNLPYLAVLFGVFALFLIACPAVAVKDEESYFGYTYRMVMRLSGAEVAFGTKDFFGQDFSASFLMIFTYFVLLSAIACTVLSIALPKFRVLFSLIGGGCFFVAMILFFCSKFSLSLSIFQFDDGRDYLDAKEEIREMSSLGAGAVLSAIFCLFASVASVFDFVFDKSKALMQAQVNKAAQAQAAAPVAEPAPAPVVEPVAEPAVEPAVEPANEAPVEEVAPSDAE